MNPKPPLLMALLATLVPAGACSKSGVEDAAPMTAADTIYVGGDIVTINDAQPAAEALAVKGGRLLAVGSRAHVESAHKGDSTRVVDLAGKDVPSIIATISTRPSRTARCWWVTSRCTAR